jgi:hypothetical protein
VIKFPKNTSVFSYYILKIILLHNAEQFIKYFYKNNLKFSNEIYLKLLLKSYNLYNHQKYSNHTNDLMMTCS